MPHHNTLIGWTYRPDTLVINLRRARGLNHVPLLVTENCSVTEEDARRIDCVAHAIGVTKEASANGVDVLGHFHRSLIDICE